MNEQREVALTVALVGLTSLAYELVQVRMLAFFLGNSMDFVAIPLALLGLAIGSAYAHYLYRGSLEGLLRASRLVIFPLILVTYLAFFFVADTFFSRIHVALADPRVDAVRLVVYGLIFLPPYAVFGAMLSALFGRYADRIGTLYFFDLAGAALGCVLGPALLTLFGLPAALLGVLAGGVALAAVELRSRPLALAGYGAGLLVVLGLAVSGVVFQEHPDLKALARYAVGSKAEESKVKQAAVRWNEIARTALMRVHTPDMGQGGGAWYVIQDNGLSNVALPQFKETTKERLLAERRHHAFPYKLGKDPKKILVIFAGAGRDLMFFHQLSEGKADVTGVEINGAVIDLARHPAVASLNLGALHDLPNVHLVEKEGRDFLNQDQQLYDHIHVANNGAVHANRTGHTRKFLDTYQAMGAYLDHLAPGGMIVFQNQPIAEKIPVFLKLFEERGLGDARRALFAFGSRDRPEIDSLLVKPGGFTDQERDLLLDLVSKQSDSRDVLWAAGAPVKVQRLAQVVEDPSSARFVTDDFPFVRGLGALSLVPNEAQLADPRFVSSWVKVFTVVLFAAVSGALALVARFLGGADARVPGVWLAFLLASGVGYMCVEIGLIAKTELFVGNPLYSVALNLAAFLIANAVGAYTQERVVALHHPAALIGLTVASVAWGLVAVEFCNDNLLSLPLVAKALAVVVATFPAGAALGMFYPTCVANLVASGRGKAVSFTYALTTLSSVLGSSLAMTLILDLGFSRVILLGLGFYLVAGALALVGRAR